MLFIPMDSAIPWMGPQLMKNILLRGGRVIDPSSGLDTVCDVLVSGERIASIAPGLDAADADIIDCGGKLVLPA